MSTRNSSKAGFYNALGHTIKVARTDLGIERKELAEQAGISYSYLAGIENGQKQPSSQVLVAIAEALGLRPHELLASAEDRRDRPVDASGSYPRWLAGDERPHRLTAAAAVDAEPMMRAMGAPPSPTDAEDEFLAELELLARRIPAADRQLLLQMASKLAR